MDIYHDTEANYYSTANPEVLVYDRVFKTAQAFDSWLVTGFKYCPISITQTGTSNPTVTNLRTSPKGLEGIVWTRNDVGDYRGTLAGAFANNLYEYTVKLYSSHVEVGSAELTKISSNEIAIKTYDLTGSPADALLNAVDFEIKVIY
jgi:hypothetical protein